MTNPEYILSLKNQGLTRRQIAEKTGLSFRQVKSRLSSAAQPVGVQKALDNSGIDVEGARHGWRVVQHEDGSRDSVFWKNNHQEEPEDVLERIAERLNAVNTVAVPSSVASNEHLLNFIPLFDFHLSMRVGDYGTNEAVQRLKDGIDDILSRLPKAETCLIVNGGDFTHQNDKSNLTPASKHPLPVDAEYIDTLDVAVELTVHAIEMALLTHYKVVYKALRGNHDENTAIVLRAALRQRYKGSERVVIDSEGVDFFTYEWGENLICAHHGDIRGKAPKDLVLGFAARYSKAWGNTTHRELHTGHLHHIKMLDIPGMLTNQHRAICPADRHSLENLYDTPSEMTGITYRKSGGRAGTVTYSF